MKILLVAQKYPPFVGGVEVHVRQISRRYRDLGHDVRIAAANFAPYTGNRQWAVLHDSLLAPTVRDHVDGGIPVNAINPQNPLERARLLPMALRAVPILNRNYGRLQLATYPAFRSAYLRKAIALCQDVDVVHSLANGLLGWTFREAAHRCGKPFVNTPFIHPHQWGDDIGDVAFYKQCDAMVGLVETDSEYMRSLGVPSANVHTIGVSPDLPDSVDGAGFRERHGLGDRPVVLYVGRMMRQKGAFALVSAMEKVWAKVPDTEFVFIGPGSAEETAIFDGIDPRARYLGKVSFQEKGDAIDACTVFCMPSMSEILPTVYLESWSLGKPVVGGRAHGLPELIEGNNAGLAVAQEEEPISSALVNLLSDPDLRARYAAAGMELVRSRYSVDAVTGQLLALYSDLVEKRNGRKSQA
jgi:phosphatidylinositol alpha-1,6-mannosyltransferase